MWCGVVWFVVVLISDLWAGAGRPAAPMGHAPPSRKSSTTHHTTPQSDGSWVLNTSLKDRIEIVLEIHSVLDSQREMCRVVWFVVMLISDLWAGPGRLLLPHSPKSSTTPHHTTICDLPAGLHR